MKSGILAVTDGYDIVVDGVDDRTSGDIEAFAMKAGVYLKKRNKRSTAQTRTRTDGSLLGLILWRLW